MKKCYGGILLASTLLFTRSVIAAEEAKQYFNIAEQPASSAMLEIAQQAQVSILFPTQCLVM